MEFSITYTPEQEAFRKEVRDWMEANAPKDLVLAPNTGGDGYTQWENRRELGRRLGQIGWLWPAMPKQYGGGGMNIDQAVVLQEVLDEYELSLPPYYDSGAQLGSVPNLLLHGTEEQRQTFLVPTLKGEVVTWLLLTEPESGSDLASVKTKATRDGDDYLINGHKTFVGDAHGVDYLWTILVTDPEAPRHQNLSFFLIPANLPGISIMPLDLIGRGGEQSRGIPGHKNSIFFDNVRVPALNLIGGEGNGWKVANTGLELEHGGGGHITRDHFRDKLFRYCREAKMEGVPLGEEPQARDELADIWARTEIDRLFGLRNYWIRHAHKSRAYEGSQSSYSGKMTGLWMTRALLNALGFSALTTDSQWQAVEGYAEGQQRAGVIAVHPGGTADVQKLIMARRIGVGRQSKEEAYETV